MHTFGHAVVKLRIPILVVDARAHVSEDRRDEQEHRNDEDRKHRMAAHECPLLLQLGNMA